jgi:site-specific DNA recombinase
MVPSGGFALKLRCAVYARYSSDLQSPTSIPDQIRMCREYADRQSWAGGRTHLHRRGASGAGADRPGLQQLLRCAQERPRKFDIVLIDDTSRLSRRQSDQSNIVDNLRFVGIRLVSVTQGIDTGSDQADVLLTVHGLVDHLYIKELGKKTHRGMEGRILKGLHAGGRCFGYRNEVGPDGVRLVIDDAEAVIVARIFEYSADGMSLKAIARKLNADRIPSPRPRKGKTRATWCPTAIRAMLRNELYTGKRIWNKSRFVKRPGTNKRVSRVRPRHEWRIIDQPDLRIISPELWTRVADRQRLMMDIYGRAGAGIHKASSSGYLLTGFLKCALCCANLIIVAGKGRKTIRKYYGCSEHFNRGACDNALKIRQDVIEQNFFAGLQRTVLTDEVLDYTIAAVTRQIHDCQKNSADDLHVVQRRKLEIEQELKRLAAAIADSGHSRFVLEAMAERERQLDHLAAKLQTAARVNVEQYPGSIRDFVKTRLSDLLGLLKTDTVRARAELAKHTREIRMIPEKGTDGQLCYVAEGGWNVMGGTHFGMVAGDGFEPPTFGL